MARLICCEGCSRHVRASELICPFCQRPQARALASPAANVPAGLSRARRMALVAALAGQALASCARDVMALPPYGAPPPPPPRAGQAAIPTEPPRAGNAGSAAGSGGIDSGLVISAPTYGLPPPPFAGHPSDRGDAGPNDQDTGIPDLPPR
jgi:hypothetical protein